MALAEAGRFRYPSPTFAAGWRRGYAPDCKSVKTGSIPVPASKFPHPVEYEAAQGCSSCRPSC